MAPTKKRSRCFFMSGKWLFNERKNRECKPSPLVGEGVSGADGRGKLDQIPQRVPYGTVLNACPSFLNGRKKRSGISLWKKYGVEWRIRAEVASDTYSDRCTQACPYRLAKLGTSLRVRGKLTLRKKKFMFLLFINTHFRLTYAVFFAKSQIMFFLSSSFRFCQPLKNDGRVVFVLPWCSDLCTHTYPFRLAKLGTGKLTLRKKEIIVFKIYYLIVAIKQ